MNREETLLKLADLFQQVSQLMKRLADLENDQSSIAVQGGSGPEAPNATTSDYRDAQRPSPADPLLTKTAKLLESKGIIINKTNNHFVEQEGLRTLARVMANKIRTIIPLLRKIKQAQDSRRSIYMSLSGLSQEAIADITLVASLANAAGMLPKYKYYKSPKYKLFADAPTSPIAINFFTGQWLEIYAIDVLRAIESENNIDLGIMSGVEIVLPNGDQFELDAVFSVAGRLIWIESKTTNNFEKHLHKYRTISERLCESERDAILLWSEHDDSNPMHSTRGVLARMTLNSPESLPDYVNELIGISERGTPDNDKLA